MQQLVMGQHPPGVDRKLEEQRVLGGRQPHRTPCHRHPVSGVVDAARLRSAALILAASSVGEKGLTT